MILKSKNSNEIEALIWVAKARSRDDLKPQIQLVVAEDDMIVATDGHRLHIYHGSVKGLEEGCYSVARQNENLIELYKYDGDTLPEYPDYKSVLPKYNLKNQKVENFSTVLNRQLNQDGGWIDYSLLIRSMHKGFTVAHPYFKAAAKYMTAYFIGDVPTKGICFMSAKRFALVLPLRTREEYDGSIYQ